MLVRGLGETQHAAGEGGGQYSNCSYCRARIAHLGSAVSVDGRAAAQRGNDRPHPRGARSRRGMIGTAPQGRTVLGTAPTQMGSHTALPRRSWSGTAPVVDYVEHYSTSAC